MKKISRNYQENFQTIFFDESFEKSFLTYLRGTKLSPLYNHLYSEIILTISSAILSWASNV